MNKASLLGLAAALIIGFSGAAWAAGDAGAGKKVFKKCKVCHTLEEGGKNRVGPNLWGILGRTAGSAEGFKFSKDMTAAGEAGLVWSEETMTEYLRKKGGGKAYIGSFIDKKKAKIKMAFPGLKKEGQAENVVAFVKENTQ